MVVRSIIESWVEFSRWVVTWKSGRSLATSVDNLWDMCIKYECHHWLRMIHLTHGLKFIGYGVEHLLRILKFTQMSLYSQDEIQQLFFAFTLSFNLSHLLLIRFFIKGSLGFLKTFFALYTNCKFFFCTVWFFFFELWQHPFHQFFPSLGHTSHGPTHLLSLLI